ncbi:MAG: glutamine amidotransferase [Halobacteriaceae archaeon]
MRVLYAGDEKLETPQFFAGAESFQVYNKVVKDYEPLLEALEGTDGVDPEHLGGQAAVGEFPDDVAALDAYDVLILSDLSCGTLQPHFREGAIPGPNRLHAIRDWVKDGGALVFCGGWMTYQGYRGVGNWAGSAVAEVLPVTVRNVFDDRVERPDGAAVADVTPDHPVTTDLDWANGPTIYGYNRVGQVEESARCLARVDGDPLLAVGEAGDGRVVSYTSDPGVMWGLGLIEWGDYEAFWTNVLDWVTGPT